MALSEKDLFIDLECGGTTSEEEGNNEQYTGAKPTKKLLGRAWDGFVSFDGAIKNEDANASSCADVCPENSDMLTDKKSGEESLGLGENKMVKEKRKKTSAKKPPKPPRPPRGPSLDAADMKLIREISELAMLKRARIERMKALKKMKASKASSSSSNVCAMVITILFCLVMLFQGMCSKSCSSSVSFQGSPETAIGVIAVQYNKTLPASDANGTNNLSPNFVEQVAGSAPGEEVSRASG
ncbi:uncharacterized protein LOC122089072 [Macadamia integrifolia]|uniref:uncharacterized protein LOC122089072 n=1 Tax=Macadamia integrifolia TaxID=60698 RepID=UPI001C4FBCCF|nr:uncharacterized protein LOC122089072 [Macadamia integrifolia]